MRKGIRILLLTLCAVIATAPMVAAQEEEKDDGCFTEFGHCMERAAAIDSFWYRTAAGLDCELDLIECARIKLIGG
jgi:hypothetical protein